MVAAYEGMNLDVVEYIEQNSNLLSEELDNQLKKLDARKAYTKIQKNKPSELRKDNLTNNDYANWLISEKEKGYWTREFDKGFETPFLYPDWEERAQNIQNGYFVNDPWQAQKTNRKKAEENQTSILTYVPSLVKHRTLINDYRTKMNTLLHKIKSKFPDINFPTVAVNHYSSLQNSTGNLERSNLRQSTSSSYTNYTTTTDLTKASIFASNVQTNSMLNSQNQATTTTTTTTLSSSLPKTTSTLSNSTSSASNFNNSSNLYTQFSNSQVLQPDATQSTLNQNTQGASPPNLTGGI